MLRKTKKQDMVDLLTIFSDRAKVWFMKLNGAIEELVE
jgi:hypothetical protein